ncbi:hypothetical protein TWF970_005785 [Orbilia oligospora]|uniref:RING-type domain-containing protein n=1 Tax=Orbilia oligospora TaxID=2813651 RepID=A0A7C8RIK9_ORBOL|nr:hypothetical protein TWF970_005785 [Orbilia oligospora]
MSDPLSLAASIAGLIALSTGLLKLANNVRETLKDEPAELVLNISKEIELLCGALSHLQVWINERGNFHYHGQNGGTRKGMDLMPVIHGCYCVVQKIQDQLLTLQTAAKRTGILKLFIAFTHKDKVKQLENLRNDLEKSKSTLILSLTVRNYNASGLPGRTSRRLSNTSDTPQAIVGIDDEIDRTEEYHGLNSFNKWLQSFARPKDSKELEVYQAKKKRQRTLESIGYASPAESPVAAGGPRLSYSEDSSSTSKQVHICVADLKLDGDDQATESIVIDSLCGFQAEDGVVKYGEITPIRRPIFLRVTSGPPSYNKRGGFLINRNQKLIDYFNELIQDEESREFLKISPSKINVEYKLHQGLKLSPSQHYGAGIGSFIQFQRTLRLPDDGAIYKGVTDFGSLSLFNTSDFKGRIPESIAAKGGYLVPLFQREAIALAFNSTGTPRPGLGLAPDEYLAMKVLVGSINLVSGLPEAKHAITNKDYIITPKQRRLNRFQVSECTARQLIAMPPARGYSLEQQSTGEEFIKGLQLMVAAPLQETPQFRIFRTFKDILDSDIDVDILKTPADICTDREQILLYIQDPEPVKESAGARESARVNVRSKLKESPVYDYPSSTYERYKGFLNGRERNGSLSHEETHDDQKFVPNSPQKLRDHRETIVEDLFWHHSSSLDCQHPQSTILKPLLEIIFLFQVTTCTGHELFRKTCTTTLEEKGFHQFLDIADFMAIIFEMGIENLKRRGFEPKTRDLTVEINGSDATGILKAYNPYRYVPITDAKSIARGGTINFIFSAPIINPAGYRFPSGSFGRETRNTSVGSLETSRRRRLDFMENLGYISQPLSVKGTRPVKCKEQLSAAPNPASCTTSLDSPAETPSRIHSPEPEPEISELCFGIQGLVYQRIINPTHTTVWDWKNSKLVNIQILNATFFQYVTGITPICRISLRLSDQALANLVKRAAFPRDINDAQVIPFNLKTVSMIDSNTPTEVSLYLSPYNVNGSCACCEVNFSDTILQPCNHIFCADCIQIEMTDICNTITCDACGIQACKTIPLASTMELPKQMARLQAIPPEETRLERTPTAENKDSEPYTTDHLAATELQRIQRKYTELILPKMKGHLHDTFVKHISFLSYSSDLFASEIRELRKLPLGARVILVEDMLRNSNDWIPKSDELRGNDDYDWAENEDIQKKKSRLVHIAQSFISLVPNVDEMHGDGDLTRIKSIFQPKSELYPGNLFCGIFDVVFKWATSGSYSIGELGVSIPKIIQLLMYWKRWESIRLVREDLEKLPKDRYPKEIAVGPRALEKIFSTPDRSLKICRTLDLGFSPENNWLGSQFPPEIPLYAYQPRYRAPW